MSKGDRRNSFLVKVPSGAYYCFNVAAFTEEEAIAAVQRVISPIDPAVTGGEMTGDKYDIDTDIWDVEEQ